MPSPVLSTAAVLTCAHGGPAQPLAGQSRVMIGGQPVATLATTYAIAFCPLPPAPAGPGPCRIGRFITAASRVTVQGQPVLLQSGASICTPGGAPLQVLTTQQRVIAV
jgi:uncharacterized Zn-binding protein involved in type VI secretion